MPAKDRRFWKCKKNHAVGEVKYVRFGGRDGRVRALMLYEQSVVGEPDLLPPLRGRVIGDMDQIRCTVCGSVKDWHIGQDALVELFEKREKRRRDEPVNSAE